MIITNEHNLPNAFKRVSESVFKKEKRSFLSGSEMDYSPRMYWLRRRYWDEIEMDVSECVWLILGIGVHDVLHKFGESKESLTEEYLKTEILGKQVSGIADIWENGVISDYKVTGTFTVVKGEFDSWIKQLNTYAFLYRNIGFDVNAIQAVPIMRDWMKAKTADPNYPQIPIQPISLPLWTQDSQLAFLKSKVADLLTYEDAPDDQLPECNKEQRWYTGDEWCVKKKGTKRAMNGGKFKLQEEAVKFAEQKEADGKTKTEIEYRPGESKRCAYCAVKNICSQYKKERETNVGG